MDLQTTSFLREQRMEHFDSNLIHQVSPIYLDLREDLMLYYVLHWMCHSFCCVMLYLMLHSLFSEEDSLCKSMHMVYKSVGMVYKSVGTDSMGMDYESWLINQESRFTYGSFFPQLTPGGFRRTEN